MGAAPSWRYGERRVEVGVVMTDSWLQARLTVRHPVRVLRDYQQRCDGSGSQLALRQFLVEVGVVMTDSWLQARLTVHASRIKRQAVQDAAVIDDQQESFSLL
jgi:hypothetical protein